MRIIRLIGVIDRIEKGIAAVVPDNGEREVYIPAEAVDGATEGLKIECLVVQGSNPNGVCRVVTKKPRKVAPPPKMASYSILVRAIEKTLTRLKARLHQVESAEEPDNEEIEALTEKISFLEKGRNLFQP